jgi:hypothetical protein
MQDGYRAAAAKLCVLFPKFLLIAKKFPASLAFFSPKNQTADVRDAQSDSPTPA